jgi:hypothetical protein
MTKADSVHSTPRLNTPADPARRRFLSTAASAAAGGAVLAMATNPPALAEAAQAIAAALPAAEATADPAFTLIAEKRAADIAHCEAIGDDADWEEEEAACLCAFDAGWELATTPPTTLAGVAAVLRFANEIEDAGNEWPDTDAIGPGGWHYELRATMAEAIEALIKAPAGKAVTS